MTQGLAILEFALGILEFPTMSSSGLTRGSLYGILEFPASLRGSKATEARNSRILYDEIIGLSRGMTKNVSRWDDTRLRNSRIYFILKYVNLFFKIFKYF